MYALGAVRLLTVLVHFSTAEQYQQRTERDVDRLRQWFLKQWSRELEGASAEKRAEREAIASRYAREGAWRPGHRFNDVAAYVEVVNDHTTIKSYAFVATDRKTFRRVTRWRTPRRDLQDRVYLWIGKVSETSALRHTPTSEEIRIQLASTRDQIASWALEHRWRLEWDDPLVACTDWAQYIRLQQEAHPTD